MQRTQAHRSGSRISHLRTFLLAEGWIWDWLLSAVLIAINFSIPGNVVEPFDRWAPRDDPSLSFPKAQTVLKANVKYPMLFIVPAVIGALWQVHKRSWLDWHNLVLSVFEGLAVETSFRKWMGLVGRQRPDWYARTDEGDEAEVLDGRFSYPSGISAETMMAATVLTLYLMGKLRLFVHARKAHFFWLLVSLLPVGLATAISMVRLSAYHHHFSDINAGMALGAFAGAVAYFLNFHSLFHKKSHEPRARSPADDESDQDAGLPTATNRHKRRNRHGRRGHSSSSSDDVEGGYGRRKPKPPLAPMGDNELMVPLTSALAPISNEPVPLRGGVLLAVEPQMLPLEASPSPLLPYKEEQRQFGQQKAQPWQGQQKGQAQQAWQGQQARQGQQGQQRQQAQHAWQGQQTQEPPAAHVSVCLEEPLLNALAPLTGERVEREVVVSGPAEGLPVGGGSPGRASAGPTTPTLMVTRTL